MKFTRIIDIVAVTAVLWHGSGLLANAETPGSSLPIDLFSSQRAGGQPAATIEQSTASSDHQAAQQPPVSDMAKPAATPLELNGFDSPAVIPQMDLAKVAKRTVAFACMLGAVCVIVIYVSHQRAQKTRGRSKQMRVIETMSIAPRCFCDLVQVGDQVLVVARDATGIQSVNPVTMPFEDELEAQKTRAEESGAPLERSFANPIDNGQKIATDNATKSESSFSAFESLQDRFERK